MHAIVGPFALLEGAMLAGIALLALFRHKAAVRQPLNCVESGAGPRAVFLHGLGATLRYWQQQDAAPVAGRVTLIDLLGFGDSPKPWFRHNVDRHLERLHAIIGDGRGQTLVGHSLGAALALAYTARYPDRVGRLVLLSLPYFPGGERAAHRWLRQSVEGWLFTNIVLMTVTCVITRRVIGPLLPYLRRDLPREIAQDAVKHSWMASTSSLWDVVYRHDLRVDADALPDTLPVLCIHGERDLTIPPSGVRQLAAGRRNWRVVTLPGVDHHPWLRQPRLCREAIVAAAGNPVSSMHSAPTI
jgi:pimeloyl-ACP methyl ester carboxylesterase